MKIENLNSSLDYFNCIVRLNFEEFMNNPSTFQRAYNLANSLFHMHEWVFAYDKSRAEKYFKSTFLKPYEVWSAIEQQEADARFIRDVANAAKHVKIKKNPSTSMTHQANTFIQTVGWGEGRWGVGRYAAPSIMMKDGKDEKFFDECAQKTYNIWERFYYSP